MLHVTRDNTPEQQHFTRAQKEKAQPLGWAFSFWNPATSYSPGVRGRASSATGGARPLT